MRIFLVAFWLACLTAGCGNSATTGANDQAVEPTTASVSVSETPPPPLPPPPHRPDPPPPKRLALLPLGDISAVDVGLASASISGTYGWIVDVLPAQDPPSSAWTEKRKRHRAEKILDWLRPQLPENADRIMALTALDISTTKPPHEDWGICGLADMPGAASVVSTFRIRKKMGGKTGAERQERYEQRLRDLAAHEFGHQLGLEHCPNVGCVMEDAKGTVSTFDRSTGALCADCAAALAEAGFPLPGATRPL